MDVVAVLSENAERGAYWKKLKQRLKKEGSEVMTFCHGLQHLLFLQITVLFDTY